MESLRVKYQVEWKDYRMATWYAMFIRYRRPLQIMFLVVIGSLLYALAAYLGLGIPNMLVFFLAGAYLLWGLVIFVGTERKILQYMREKDNMIGCMYEVEVKGNKIRVSVPERKIDVSYELNRLACVFEISALFMIYTSPQEVYLLPKRALSENERKTLRECFHKKLKERFSSRFS